jgi:hypothetical protein
VWKRDNIRKTITYGILRQKEGFLGVNRRFYYKNTYFLAKSCAA